MDRRRFLTSALATCAAPALARPFAVVPGIAVPVFALRKPRLVTLIAALKEATYAPVGNEPTIAHQIYYALGGDAQMTPSSYLTFAAYAAQVGAQGDVTQAIAFKQFVLPPVYSYTLTEAGIAEIWPVEIGVSMPNDPARALVIATLQTLLTVAP